jgi:hypothetical protein
MTIEQLTVFLGWSTVINAGLMLWAVIALALMPDLVYKMQGLVTKLRREDLEKAMYHFLGLFKLGIIFLNFTPYLVLRLFF